MKTAKLKIKKQLIIISNNQKILLLNIFFLNGLLKYKLKNLFL
jgi:hypothetical protein